MRDREVSQRRLHRNGVVQELVGRSGVIQHDAGVDVSRHGMRASDLIFFRSLLKENNPAFGVPSIITLALVSANRLHQLLLVVLHLPDAVRALCRRSAAQRPNS